MDVERRGIFDGHDEARLQAGPGPAPSADITHCERRHPPTAFASSQFRTGTRWRQTDGGCHQGRGDAWWLPGGGIRLRRRQSGTDIVPLPSATAHGFWLHGAVQLRMSDASRRDGMEHHAEPVKGNAAEVFAAFLRLGVTSFGGPIAHLGYFRAEFVERRRWLDEHAYADIVALSQFLPGPASSQTGFAIGLLRAGYLGGLAAWLGFTTPSAILLLLFAYGAGDIASSTLGSGVLHGLKLVAVAIVAQAIWGMARTLCPDRARASIAVLALILLLVAPGSLSQVAAIVVGGIAGLLFSRNVSVTSPDAIAMPV